MKIADLVGTLLLIVGGVNWGLWGAAELDLVAALCGGSTAALAKVVYVLVGLAGLFKLVRLLTPASGQRRLAAA